MIKLQYKTIKKDNAMEYILLAFLIALYTAQSLFTKLYTDKYPGEENDASNILTVVSGLSVAIITLVFFSRLEFTFNIYCILIGLLNAFALYFYNYSIVKASRTGPYSILMMFSLSGGIIIPIIVALIAGWDSWSTVGAAAVNIVSIITIIASVYLVSSKDEAVSTDEPTKNATTARGVSLKFILSCFLLAISNGVYGIFLTLQQRSEIAGGEGNRDEMIIATYLFAAIISFVVGIVKKKGKFFGAFRQNKWSAIWLIATSLVFALAINLIVIIIPLIPTTILYTLDNSSVLIMSVLISCIFFREKLSLKNIIGIILMVIALVSMNILPPMFN